MADQFTLKKSHKADYQALSRVSKSEYVDKLFVALVDAEPDRKLAYYVQEICKRTGAADTVVYRYARQGKYKERLIGMQADRVRAADEEKLKERHDGVKRDIPFSKLISEIKDFSWLMVKTSRSLAETHAAMIEYYSLKINDKIKEVGGVAYLKDADSKQVEVWQRNLKHYTDGIKEFLKPNQIASYLKMVGIESAIVAGMEDIDQSAFTMAKLQETYAEINGSSGIIGDQGKIDEVFKPYTDQMPDITASR